MATRNWSGAVSANWNVAGNWTEGAVPTAADDVVLAGSVACTLNANAACRSLDCNTYTGTLTRNAGITLTIGDGTAGAGNRALRIPAGMTFSDGAPTVAITFVSTSATQQTISVNSAAAMFCPFTFNGAGGSWILGLGLTLDSYDSPITVTAGTFNTGGFAVNAAALISTGSSTRVITLGASAVDLKGTGTILNCIGTGLTVNANTSTITISESSASTKAFTSDRTWNNVTVSAGGSGAVNFTGGPTFNVFTVTGPKTIGFSSTATTTATDWNFNGSAANLVTIQRADVTNPQATISQAAGTVTATYCDITDSNATGGAVFLADSTCVNGGNNTGWQFVGGMAFGQGKIFGGRCLGGRSLA